MDDGSEFMFGSRPEEMRQCREVKVRVPVRFLIKLHGIKLLSGGGISETVTEALDAYFEDLDHKGLPQERRTS